MSIRTFLHRTKQYLLHGIPVYKTYPTIAILPPNELLKGRKALVTGGTSGIGFEIAKSFVNAGANVVITGRSQKRIDEACSKISSIIKCKDRIHGKVMDNKDIAHMNDCLQEIIADLNGLDILVNNAGIHGGHILNATEDEYDTIMNTNLKGAFFLSKAFALYMKREKIQGNILNIASSSSLRPADSAYTLSKWGIRGLTEGLARSLAPYNIVVNGIAPGPTATRMLMHDVNNGCDISWPLNLTKRMALPCEVANMATILVSDMGRMIIGDIVYMTGGGGIITNEDVVYHF